MAGGRTTAIAILTGLLLAAAPAVADVVRIDPAQGRISLTLDGRLAPPSSYVRQTGYASLCEAASWDGSELYGQVAHCEAMGDHVWRRGFIDISLLFQEFPFLGDFVDRPPAALRAVATRLGRLTLYGFDVDDRGTQGRQCVGFVQGYDAAGAGYREMLVGYACSDTGTMTDGDADRLLRGLSVAGSFDGLLP